MLLKKLGCLGATALLALSLCGCTAQTKAQAYANILQGVINVAAAEESNVSNPAFTAYVSFAQSVETQLQSCIASVSSMSLTKSAKFSACFNDFAVGLSTPSELAALRVASSSAQSRAQFYITAAIIGVNTALSYFGGTSVTAPVVSSVQPTTEQLDALRAQVMAHLGE